VTDRSHNPTLQALWQALLAYLVNQFKHPPSGGLKASFLAVCCRFLADNGCIQPSGSGDPETMRADPTSLAAKLKALQADNPQ